MVSYMCKKNKVRGIKMNTIFNQTKKADVKGAARNEFEGKILRINVLQILPNPAQPRKSFDNESLIRLADSIRQYGILQPLTVRRIVGNKCSADAFPQSVKDEHFEIIAGERRLRAAKLIGMMEVPCIVIDASAHSSAEMAIIENIQRENLNMFEQAAAIASLIDIYSLTQEQIAKRLSLSQSYVANKLRILRLTSRERALILTENLSERHARAVLRIEDTDERCGVIQYIAKKHLNVAETEEYIEKLLQKAAEAERDKSTERVEEKHRKFIIKDIRIFYNSIDRAIEFVKKAGIDITSEKKDLGEDIELTIRIPKNQATAY